MQLQLLAVALLAFVGADARICVANCPKKRDVDMVRHQIELFQAITDTRKAALRGKRMVRSQRLQLENATDADKVGEILPEAFQVREPAQVSRSSESS
jgi:hypothetical protein